MNKKVYGYIQRKSMLYVTGVEYGDYTMNHVQGCAHGCKYPCYAFMMKKRFGQIKSYEQWIRPYLVSNTIELLIKEIPKLKNKINTVQLCFTTDPFMYGYDEIKEMSLKAIELLNSNDIKCSVLTKGILPSELADFSTENEYGITLVSLDEDFRKRMEPYTAPYVERIQALRDLHDLGFKTWVSIEPYPTPNIFEQDLVEILNKIDFVDKIIFGRLNYNKEVSNYKEYKFFYNDMAFKVIEFCNINNIQYHIKNGTISG
ncbi:radical SAM protein [Catenibacterium mitsuokai]|uniref:radical SAM protein n=1 Tax=Catenibacterium mitsuokai TaxID=100886 RepID=UPI002E794039|nr:radical SAM protein [Catenibacterium tridentinum]